MPLTDTACRSAKPASKTRRLFDGKGLYLELSPAGGRWWRLKYRMAGKEKRLSLGVYPDVSLAKAREKCDDARRLLAAGVDPSQHRQAAKAALVSKDANSFEVVAREWHAKQARAWVTDKLAAPLETIYDEEGAVLMSGVFGPPFVLPSPYFPLIAPENFTDFQTPQGGSAMWFG